MLVEGAIKDSCVKDKNIKDPKDLKLACEKEGKAVLLVEVVSAGFHAGNEAKILLNGIEIHMGLNSN